MYSLVLENAFMTFPLAMAIFWWLLMPAVKNVLLTTWSRTSAFSAWASDASDSSFSAGRLAKAPLVGAKTVHGPAESTK